MVFYKEPGLTIRSMIQEDIEALLENFARQDWHKPRNVLEAYYKGQGQGVLTVFLAEWQGNAAGYTVLYQSAANGPFSGQGIPEISDFLVFQPCQRRGIGGKILDTAEKRAAQWHPTVSLSVGLHAGYGPAQRMYAKRGYVPDGSGVWYKNVPLAPYAKCKNDDELVLYLSKRLY